MPTRPDPFDEFLRQLAPLMESPPLYQSLEFACVAARHHREWILISGKAVLSPEPCASESQIVPVAQLQQIIALQGRTPTGRIKDLVADLRDSCVVKGLKGIEIRLGSKGSQRYSWGWPKLISVDRSQDPAGPWNRVFALYGNDPDPSSFLSYSTFEEIDSQLRSSAPAINGFDGLCGKLGLPVRRSSLTSSFQVSAELPARVLLVRLDQPKTTLEVVIECIGAPDLMVEWFPQYELQRIPTGWIRKPDDIAHLASLTVPYEAKTADLILSFGELQADVSTVDVSLAYSYDDLGVIPLDVVYKQPTVHEPPSRKAPNQESGPQELPKPSGKRSWPKYRKKLQQDILAQLRKKNLDASDEEVCQGMDKTGRLDPNSTWSKGGKYFLHTQALEDSDLGETVHSAISKVRTDLRKRGWTVPYRRGPRTLLTSPLTG